MNLHVLVRELRLMKEQPSHRFYAMLALVVVAIVSSFLFRSTLFGALLNRLSEWLIGGYFG